MANINYLQHIVTMTLRSQHLGIDKEGKIYITTDTQILQLGKLPQLHNYRVIINILLGILLCIQFWELGSLDNFGSLALDICISTELVDNLLANAIYQPHFC